MRLGTRMIIGLAAIMGLILVGTLADAQMMMGRGMMGMGGMMGPAWGSGGMMGPGYWGSGGYMYGPYGQGYGYPSMEGYESEDMDKETLGMVKELDEQARKLEELLAVEKPDKDKVMAQQKKLSELRAKLEEKELEERLKPRPGGSASAYGPPGYGYGYGAPGWGRWGGWGGGFGRGSMAGPGSSRWGYDPRMYGGYGMGPGYGMESMPRDYYQNYPQTSPDIEGKKAELRKTLEQKQKEMTDLLGQQNLDRKALQEKSKEIEKLQADLDMMPRQ
ncbi:MAG: hypothetical protein HY788_03205 [Deltaproteobacteria bacterium]|nr:hypothetical protein [Deltaproteobacteria bacterium]